jgi:hypothetical protein
MTPRVALFALICFIFSFPVSGGTTRYSLTLPRLEAAHYEIPFRVAHPGKIAVELAWADNRIVALRIDGPDDVISRRSGPSPQRLAVEVRDEVLDPQATWRVRVRVPPGRDEGVGTLTLTLPDPVQVPSPEAGIVEPPPPPPPVLEPWTLPRQAPEGSGARLESLYDAVEAFRVAVYPSRGEASPDGCGWQRPLMKWLARSRDNVGFGLAGLSGATREFLVDLAAAVQSVETLRTTENPLLAGPVPEDDLRRRAWEAARRDELRGLERMLDDLGEQVRDGLPEMEGLDWPSRFVACLTAAERYFDDRAKLGDRADNRDLALTQWPAFLAAARALEAMAAVPSP